MIRQAGEPEHLYTTCGSLLPGGDTCPFMTMDPNHEDEIRYHRYYRQPESAFSDRCSSLPGSGTFGHLGDYRPKARKAPSHWSAPWPSVDELLSESPAPASQLDPVAGFLSERKLITHLGLTDTLSQIHERVELYLLHKNEIEKAELNTLNTMHGFPTVNGYVHPELYQDILRSLQQLEQQQRRERLDFWSDISRLRQSLPDAMDAYLDSCRKMRILNGLSLTYGTDAPAELT